MAGKENLKPTNRRSKEEARQLGKLGGIKSGEVRKAKKTLKEQLLFAIEIYTKKKLNDPNITEEQKNILTESNVLVLDLLNTALNSKVKHETRLKANDMVMDRIYGKAKQEIEATNINFNSDLENLSTEKLEQIKNIIKS